MIQESGTQAVASDCIRAASRLCRLSESMRNDGSESTRSTPFTAPLKLSKCENHVIYLFVFSGAKDSSWNMEGGSLRIFGERKEGEREGGRQPVSLEPLFC